jgi:hypothetical protein
MTGRDWQRLSITGYEPGSTDATEGRASKKEVFGSQRTLVKVHATLSDLSKSYKQISDLSVSHLLAMATASSR